MPLQLVNLSPNPIRLVAGLPVCQVRFGALSTPAKRPYGDPGLGSIYVDDDGGPSYWWRDKRIRQLHDRLAERSVDVRIQKQLETSVGTREPEVIERRVVDARLGGGDGAVRNYPEHADQWAGDSVGIEADVLI